MAASIDEADRTISAFFPDGGEPKSLTWKPYNRKLEKDRTMPHKPKLKLEQTPIEMDPVSIPKSLPGFYPMNSHPHGTCLIINNKFFADEGHKVHHGTLCDEENLTETFRFLGYRVEVRREQTKPEIEQNFNNIDDLIEDNDDSFVCCILSHGNTNIIYGSDSQKVTLRTAEHSIEMKLTRSRKLVGKPKIFFVAACRGTKAREGIHADGDGDEDENQDFLKPVSDGESDAISRRADLIFHYGTLEGEKGWRIPDTGTLYISTLCCTLCKHASQYTLNDIQRKVAEEVQKIEIPTVIKEKQTLRDILACQLPSSEAEQTTKNVYFFKDFFPEEGDVVINTKNVLA